MRTDGEQWSTNCVLDVVRCSFVFDSMVSFDDVKGATDSHRPSMVG